MCPRWACVAPARRTDRPTDVLTPQGSLDADLGELGGVVAEDVDDLHDDRVAPRLGVLVPVALRSEQGNLTGPICLPLVVENVVAEVEVDGPVVDEIRPGLD